MLRKKPARSVKAVCRICKAPCCSAFTNSKAFIFRGSEKKVGEALAERGVNLIEYDKNLSDIPTTHGVCVAKHSQQNLCLIHPNKPRFCLAYPFVVRESGGKLAMILDTRCPEAATFAKKRLHTFMKDNVTLSYNTIVVNNLIEVSFQELTRDPFFRASLNHAKEFAQLVKGRLGGDFSFFDEQLKRKTLLLHLDKNLVDAMLRGWAEVNRGKVSELIGYWKKVNPPQAMALEGLLKKRK